MSQNNSHKQILTTLKASLSPEHLQQAAATVDRLYKELPDKKNLQNNHIMVLMGGGKDSAWTTAYTRLVQLMMEEKHGDTFTLSSATGRHPGMQLMVMQNIDRAYKALGMYDDPLVQIIMIHNSKVVPFDPSIPMPDEVIRLNRTDVLMNAHRFAADARRTFCDSCNRNLSNWIGVAAAFNHGADIVVTGDSLKERGDYAKWITKLADNLGVQTEDFRRMPQFKKIMNKMDGIAREHTNMVHGNRDETHKDRQVQHDFPKETKFFTIFSDAAYTARDHMPFLKNFLKFDFDTLMSSFTETDCGNPALMAHLHGVAAERLFHARYEDGVREYVDYGIRLMNKKDFPDELVDMMRERYKDDAAIQSVRKKVEQYAWDAYQFTPQQMTAMVYAPFTGRGANLNIFLKNEHPEFLPSETAIRNLLSSDALPKQGEAKSLAHQLENISGLTIEQLQRNYNSPLVRNLLSDAQDASDLADKLRIMGIGDPHQEQIITTINVRGIPKPVNITGR